MWTRKQQIDYVEFILKGGPSGKDLYFNHPGWQDDYKGDFVLVDGLQRITAVLAFLNDEIPAFGYMRKDFTDKIPMECHFRVNVAKLQTKREVLDWYIVMNSGGTPHSEHEIDKVKKLKGNIS